MPLETPLPDWTGEDVFVIGGGHSLKSFNWSQLEGLNTIGCNQAFMLGPDLCNICTFGDFTFWNVFKPGGICSKFVIPLPNLSSYDGWVVTSYLAMNTPKWLKFFPRENTGLAARGTGRLSWNNNTGCSATNLALTLGAKRVLLLGMDMRLGEQPNKSHWHDKAIEVPVPSNYTKFIGGFQSVADALPQAFPGCEILNVTDGSSELHVFPRVSFESVRLLPPRKE